MDISGIVATGKRFGYLNAIANEIHRIVNKFTTFLFLRTLILDLDDVDPKFLAPVEGLQFGVLTPEKAFVFGEDPEIDLPRYYLERAFAKGDRCYAYIDGGNLASYGWYSTQPTALLEEFEVHFDPSRAYMYAGFTGRKYRGRRLHAYGMCAACKDLVDEGKQGLISLVDFQNFNSRASAQRLGYKVFGWVFILKLFGRYLIAHAPACREYGLEIRPMDRKNPSVETA